MNNEEESQYVALHVQKRNRTNNYTTQYVTRCLREHKPIVFTKFGDGEVQCMQFYMGTNCDGDEYTCELGHDLNSVFIQFCDMANNNTAAENGRHDRILLGRWHHPPEVSYLARLYFHHMSNKGGQAVNEIPFVNYHLIYNDDDFHRSRDLYDFVKAIQSFSQHKVFISNPRNARLVRLFGVDDFIQIASSSWYKTSFSHVYTEVERILAANPAALVLIAGGLASKVLISRLCEKYPHASFLDIGSGFDILATRHCTRDHKHTYEAECSYYKDLLPIGW